MATWASGRAVKGTTSLSAEDDIRHVDATPNDALYHTRLKHTRTTDQDLHAVNQMLTDVNEGLRPLAGQVAPPLWPLLLRFTPLLRLLLRPLEGTQNGVEVPLNTPRPVEQPPPTTPQKRQQHQFLL